MPIIGSPASAATGSGCASSACDQRPGGAITITRPWHSGSWRNSGWLASCRVRPMSVSRRVSDSHISAECRVDSSAVAAGQALRSKVVASGTSDCARVGVQVTRSGSLSGRAKFAVSRCRSCRSRMIFSTRGRSSSACSVGCSRPRTRWNRVKPSWCSACCSALLAAGCEMFNRFAAPVRLLVVITAWNSSM